MTLLICWTRYRGCPKEMSQGRNRDLKKIYDLVDVVERKPRMAVVDKGLHDEIMKRSEEIAEKIAREVIPDIAERLIREEIDRLKKSV